MSMRALTVQFVFCVRPHGDDSRHPVPFKTLLANATATAIGHPPASPDRARTSRIASWSRSVRGRNPSLPDTFGETCKVACRAKRGQASVGAR